jgi:hypothetical protein
VDAGGGGEVAGGPVFGGHGEHVAAGADHCPGAVGRDVEGGDFLGDVPAAAAAAGEVFPDLHRDALDAFGGEVEPVEEAAVFEHDAGVPEGRELDGELGEGGERAGLAGLQIEDVQVGLAQGVAFGHEVDPVAAPHREDVLRRVLGEAARFPGVEVIEPDLVGLAAAVAFPGAELAEDAVVGELPAVGGEAAPAAAGEGELFRRAAGEPGEKQLALERVPLDAPASGTRRCRRRAIRGRCCSGPSGPRRRHDPAWRCRSGVVVRRPPPA